MIVEFDVTHGYVGFHFSGLFVPPGFCADSFVGRYVSDAGFRSIGFSLTFRRPGVGFGYGLSKYYKAGASQ